MEAHCGSRGVTDDRHASSLRCVKLVSTNPSDDFAVLGEVEVSSPTDVRHAVERARNAQPDWAACSLEERCSAIQSFVNVARSRSEEIKSLIATETGRPYSNLDVHLNGSFKYLESYCNQAPEHLAPKTTFANEREIHTVHREPWGVVAAICPWNYPFMNVVWQCGQALIAGNAVVYKNSEENPLFAMLVGELFDQSDVPDGVFNVLQGDGTVGRLIVESGVDMVSFTGSSATGRTIARLAAERFVPFAAELGGSSPTIVFEDIEVDSVIDTIFDSRFTHSGQICVATKRLVVHESKFEELTSKLVTMAESRKIGRAIEPETQLGPLVAERQVTRIASQVEDAVAQGASILTGGARPDGLKGAYYLPTILTNVTREMRVWHEETFGPVLPIVSFTSEAQAVELANDTDYGLNAWVMTSDDRRFARVASQIKAGSVVQNNGTYTCPTSPFGGFKNSGQGRVHGEFGFHEVTQVKLVSNAL